MLHAALLCVATLLVTADEARAQSSVADEAARERNLELGKRHANAWDLYQALRRDAEGGERLGAATTPDWRGVWSRPIEYIGLFDSTQNRAEPPTAKLTPEYQARLDEKLSKIKQGLEYDPLGRCDPPGHPRWLVEPFLREFVVTPDQTWLINEVANEIRRVYTDGREHLAEGGIKSRPSRSGGKSIPTTSSPTCGFTILPRSRSRGTFTEKDD